MIEINLAIQNAQYLTSKCLKRKMQNNFGEWKQVCHSTFVRHKTKNRILWCSFIRNIKHGVSQRSVLGPLCINNVEKLTYFTLHDYILLLLLFDVEKHLKFYYAK